MLEVVTTLTATRKAKGHTCRSLGQVAGVSHEAVSRLERVQKGRYGTLRNVAAGLGYDVRLFTVTGEMLTFALDAEHVGKQLYRYRREVLRKTRKALAVQSGLTQDCIGGIEHDPCATPFQSVELYAVSLGLRLGLTRRIEH